MWQTNIMNPELLDYILKNIYKNNGQAGGASNFAQNQLFPQNTDAITGIQPANGNMWGVNTQNNPVAPQQVMPQYKVSENYTQNPNILAEAQKVQTLRDVNALEMDKYNKMMMEDYLNKQAFGSGSQITGTMPYYADRMGRGIQGGNKAQMIGGGLGLLFQGVKGVFAGMGQQKTEDFLKSEGQQKMREYMKSGKGIESLYNNFAMGYSGNFAEGGEMPMEEQMPMEQEVPQEQVPQGEEILFAYFEANQFNEQQAQEFMQYFQSLAPEEQQAAIQEMAAALSPQQGEQPEMKEEQEEPTILDGKTMSESTKVVRKGKKDFLQIIKETPISKKEAKDFRKFM